MVQRRHSREPVFYETADYRAYLNWLVEASERYTCAVQAYVLMTNHVHLLVTPKDLAGISRMRQYVGRRYVPYINAQYGTNGSFYNNRSARLILFLWLPRFVSTGRGQLPLIAVPLGSPDSRNRDARRV